MTQTDAKFIAELRALAEKATHGGGWRVKRDEFDYSIPTRKGVALEIVTVLDHPQLKGPDPIVCRCDRRTDDAAFKHGVWITEENAAFIAASRTAIPRLLDMVDRLTEALALIEIKQPDGDGLVWASFVTPQRQFGSFNLGTVDRFATKVALEFERLRRAALAPKE